MGKILLIIAQALALGERCSTASLILVSVLALEQKLLNKHNSLAVADDLRRGRSRHLVYSGLLL